MTDIREDGLSAAADPLTRPDELLELAKLADEEDAAWAYEVFQALAQNPNTPTEALDILADLHGEQHFEAKEEAAAHPNVSLETLTRLYDDGYANVGRFTRNNLALHAAAEHGTVSPLLAFVGFYLDFTPEQYDELRGAPDEWVRAMLPPDD